MQNMLSSVLRAAIEQTLRGLGLLRPELPETTPLLTEAQRQETVPFRQRVARSSLDTNVMDVTETVRVPRLGRGREERFSFEWLRSGIGDLIPRVRVSDWYLHLSREARQLLLGAQSAQRNTILRDDLSNHVASFMVPSPDAHNILNVPAGELQRVHDELKNYINVLGSHQLREIPTSEKVYNQIVSLCQCYGTEDLFLPRHPNLEQINQSMALLPVGRRYGVLPLNYTDERHVTQHVTQFDILDAMDSYDVNVRRARHRLENGMLDSNSETALYLNQFNPTRSSPSLELFEKVIAEQGDAIPLLERNLVQLGKFTNMYSASMTMTILVPVLLAVGLGVYFGTENHKKTKKPVSTTSVRMTAGLNKFQKLKLNKHGTPRLFNI